MASSHASKRFVVPLRALAPSLVLDGLTFATVGVLLVLVGFGAAGGWYAPLTHDEELYYLPAIRSYAELLPAISLNPPFPGPPTGLVLQGLVFRAFDGSVFALRMTSTIATGATVILTAHYLRRFGAPVRHGAYLLALSFNPFVFYHGFVFKQHAITFLFLMLGLVCWNAMGNSAGLKPKLFAAMFLVMAITSNPLVVAICGALAYESWWERGKTSDWLGRLVAASVPVATLISFFVFWGGTIPPAYRAQPVVTDVNFGALHPEQLLAAGLTIGFWLGPLCVRRKFVTHALVLSLPFAVAFYVWDGYDPTRPFFKTIVGPISTVLRAATARSPLGASVLGGLICGFAFELVLRARNDGRGIVRLGVLAGFYVLMMLGVPYLFESYYVILLLPAFFILRGRITESWRSPLARIYFASVPLAGVLYTWYKLFIFPLQ